MKRKIEAKDWKDVWYDRIFINLISNNIQTAKDIAISYSSKPRVYSRSYSSKYSYWDRKDVGEVKEPLQQHRIEGYLKELNEYGLINYVGNKASINYDRLSRAFLFYIRNRRDDYSIEHIRLDDEVDKKKIEEITKFFRDEGYLTKFIFKEIKGRIEETIKKRGTTKTIKLHKFFIFSIIDRLLGSLLFWCNIYEKELKLIRAKRVSTIQIISKAKKRLLKIGLSEEYRSIIDSCYKIFYEYDISEIKRTLNNIFNLYKNNVRFKITVDKGLNYLELAKQLNLFEKKEINKLIKKVKEREKLM